MASVEAPYSLSNWSRVMYFRSRGFCFSRAARLGNAFLRATPSVISIHWLGLVWCWIMEPAGKVWVLLSS